MDGGGERALHYVAPVPRFHIWQEKTTRPMDKPMTGKEGERERSHKLHQQRPPLQAHVQGRRAAAAATRGVVAVTEPRPPRAREQKTPSGGGIKMRNDANRRKRKKKKKGGGERWTVDGRKNKTAPDR